LLEKESRLGPYEIVAPLGKGGMGEVYRARDTRLGREVALKVLPEVLAGDPDRRARFEREARAAAALSHPSILSIHDFDTEGAVTYAVMELLEGETLRSRLQSGPLSWRKVTEIGIGVAEGLEAAHAKGIIHRDLKPENLMLVGADRVKILDFGLARVAPGGTAKEGPVESSLTDTGAVIGTVGYMSPEQLRGRKVDGRSDIFSLGCVLYELVAGQPAFPGGTAAEVMTAILHDEPGELTASGREIPAGLESLIRRCLEKSPAARMQSAQDVAFSLRALAGSAPASRKLSSPLRMMRWAAPLGLVAVLGGGTAMLLSRRLPDTGQAASPSVVHSVAVLPFHNDTGDAALDFLGTGITEDLIDRLGLLPGLKVMSRDAVFRVEARDMAAREIGKDLGVEAVLTGSVRSKDGTVSIHSELVSVKDGSRLGGGNHEGNLSEVQSIRDSILEDLGPCFGHAASNAAPTGGPMVDAEAYLLYQRGLHHWQLDGEANLRRALDLFSQATEKDPRFAAAWSGIARSYARLSDGFARPNEVLPLAKGAVARALQLDDQDATAHLVASVLFLFHDHDLLAAEGQWRESRRLNPRSTDGLQLEGFFLAIRGRFADAVKSSAIAVAADPYSYLRNITLLLCCLWAGEYDRTIEEGRNVLERNPSMLPANLPIGLALSLRGDHEEAIAVLDGLRRVMNTPRAMAHLGFVLGRAGRHEEARGVLRELEDSSGKYIEARLLAMVNAGLGQVDEAFRWLRQGVEDGDVELVFLAIDPVFADLHDDPRFDALVRDLGLPRLSE